jgi:hypothetical protein
VRTSSLARRVGPLVASAAVLAWLLVPPAQAAVGDSPTRLRAPMSAAALAVPSLPPELVAATRNADGVVVRRGDGLTVERISVPAALGASDPSLSATVWEVMLEGRFPPRALRYVMFADDRPVGYGWPAPGERALVTITADDSVLTGLISARYEGLPSAAASQLKGEPAPTPPSGPVQGRLDDPALGGPYPVTRAVYDLGDEVFRPTNLHGKVEITADVHYPTGLPDGPYPLVLFLHGNHSSCYRGDLATYEWPCPEGSRPLPNFEGYDYIARRLAAYGFVVVSVSANGVNVLGNRVSDTGMRQRGELLERHLDLWRRWSTTGAAPFGSRFVGRVDLSRIGTMGHSRGGEGVVWQVLVDRLRADPYGIDAVLPLAPVDFTRATVNRVPLAVVLPSCDGDVSDLQGVHFFDDARYRVPGDVSPKHTVTVVGANHNFFNTVWSPSGGYPGSFDDGASSCPARLSETEQRGVGATYIVGFFRRYLADERSIDPMWTGAARPRSVSPARTLVSYLAPDRPSRRLDLDRFTDETSILRNALDGEVTPTGLSRYSWCADTFSDRCVPDPFAYADVHLPSLGQGVLGWADASAGVRFALPPGYRNLRRFDAFQFRAAVNPGYPVNEGIPFQDLDVVLVDGEGDRTAVAASDVGNQALAYPAGLRRYVGHFILNQVRFPLDDFRGVDLRDVRAVHLRFDRTEAGVIDLADAAFSSGARSNV